MCRLTFFLFFSLILLLTGCSKGQPEDNARYVDPFIGTAAHGHTFPGAVVPFGMVQLSPDNGRNGWDWCSGYNYSDSIIVGFSHKHLSGTGIGDLADILLQPTTENLEKGEYHGGKEFHQRFRAIFSHAEESAAPGYYRVILRDPKTLQNPIRVELTATERTGFHRYRYPEGSKMNVVLDLGFAINWDQPEATMIRVINDTLVTGYRKSKGWANNQQVYFAATFSKPMTRYSLFETGLDNPGIKTVEGKYTEAILSFGNKGGELMVKVALSPVDEHGALHNLVKENPGWKFDKVKKAARLAWNHELGKIQIESGNPDLKETFYTALYHTMIAPALFSDIDGRYRGSDSTRTVKKADGWKNYTVYSLWDTFRAANPLFILIQPERMPDLIKAMLAHYEESGLLPVWTLEGCETNCMIGYHAIPVIVDAAMKGVVFDYEKAFEAMKKSAMHDGRGLKNYRTFGYLPADLENQSVSQTLEYAYDDWCIAQMAKKLGKDEDYQYFMNRSRNYRNVFDPETRFMRGRMSDGTWRQGFNPLNSSHNVHDFTEGNSWQYSWFVPQDPEDLMSLMGGKEKFIIRLDSLFNTSEKVQGADASPDISGMVGQYAQGNEPSHHVAYLYNIAGEPAKTQEIIHRICTTLYTNQPDGLCGNEDCGQMSAWYVFSAMGFYPMNPANGVYQIGTPSFSKVTLNLPGGKTFTVTAENLTDKNFYIKSVILNGKPLDRMYITHQEIVAGGQLQLVMAGK
ncbi:MAG: glycoside hydrolase family 92 protein [Porphyromonadaceae bacterium]|nr:MAG: glycoside hydrolase family 92 protein [Porphyromonadaceae bacterium]